MKKVLIIANNDLGLYKFRKELIETLLRSYEVILLLPQGDYIFEFQKMGCRYYRNEYDRHGINPIEEYRLLHFYKKVIREIKPDIVLTYTIKPNIYGGITCARLKIPYIVNITGLGTAVENKGCLQLITVALYKYALRRAQMVFFQNKDNLSFMLKKGITKGNYDLLPGSGVNLTQYKPLPYPNGDTVSFLFVGRIMREKGIDQYIDAARYIRQKYTYTQFHICGPCEHDYIEKLNKLQNQGIIIYHGLVKDMMKIYQIASCTVHPTYYPEGMSNVLLESCASARPIITTDRPGCREIVDDGRNGYICKQKDSADLILQIEKFLTLPYEKKKEMGLYGRTKVEKEFDRNIVIKAYLEEIERAFVPNELQEDNKKQRNKNKNSENARFCS